MAAACLEVNPEPLVWSWISCFRVYLSNKPLVWDVRLLALVSITQRQNPLLWQAQGTTGLADEHEMSTAVSSLSLQQLRYPSIPRIHLFWPSMLPASSVLRGARSAGNAPYLAGIWINQLSCPKVGQPSIAEDNIFTEYKHFSSLLSQHILPLRSFVSSTKALPSVDYIYYDNYCHCNNLCNSRWTELILCHSPLVSWIICLVQMLFLSNPWGTVIFAALPYTTHGVQLRNHFAWPQNGNNARVHRIDYPLDTRMTSSTDQEDWPVGWPIYDQSWFTRSTFQIHANHPNFYTLDSIVLTDEHLWWWPYTCCHGNCLYLLKQC